MTTEGVTNNASTALKRGEDIYSVGVKAEYVLEARAASLPPVTESTEAPEAPRIDDRDNPDKKGKHKRGRNKKRPRDVRINSADKVCMAVMRGEDCPYGDKCRFEHDLKAFLATRPDDIVVEGLTCPIFQLRGVCPFGIMCRLGASHINMASGQNITAPNASDAVQEPAINSLSSELQTQLRKNTYPFVCQRKSKPNSNGAVTCHGKENGDEKEIVATSDVPVDETVAGETHEANRETKSEMTSDKDTQSAPIVEARLATETNVNVDGSTHTDEPANPTPVNDNVGSVVPAPSTHTDEPTNPTPVKDNVGVDDPSMKKPGDLGMASTGANEFLPLPSRTRKLIDFSNKVYVAPLTTVGNLPFRRVMKKFGADITCGEMALATHLLEGKPSEWALLKRHPDEDVFGIQLAAGYPDIFTRTMELVEAHVSVDFVDLNLGCPLDMVCNKGSGAALMMRDKRLQASLNGITNVLTKCQVTIKMRTGWDEKAPFAHELVPKIQSWGFGNAIGAVMVHGRSRLQRYSKAADWEYVSTVACSQDTALPTIPVIGNGDILSFTDYEEKVLQAKGVIPCAMLGRGALIKPWLPTEIKERRHWDISASERLDFLRDFVRFGLQHWGSDQQGVNNCRRFLLEWLSFLHRYVPVGLLEQTHAQRMNQRPPKFLCGRNDLETLMMSPVSSDWVKITELLLGPVPQPFIFEAKHQAISYG